ncbi:hypothetical protein BJF93_04770 [Xaviernesmea oryzae]|uniref:Capsular polysaccharide transport system permease protein n=1 Tax=Xaviernesmea oryzae TaxID=464029 RepID=A0A1Q9AUX6_9HYPH|nr:hypothetical protein [Xaviernesmea oryzae]OLP59214.1 hypothetical protein BJF93_04770 [Xaviernesmea oryzae]SEK81484.1 capsular polysaccharide transport system permease protein [Xaviernesmea oryzae]
MSTSAKLDTAKNKQGEGSLVLRLDDVRPNRVPAKRDAAPQLPTGRPRKTVVTYKTEKITGFVKTASGGISGTAVSFFLMVILPTILGALYFAFVASPQYASEFRFSVRPSSTGGGSMAAEAAVIMSNSYIVSDYILSRDAVEALDKTVGLRTIYSNENIDSWSRLSPDASIEKMVSYWKKRVSTNYDLTTGINIVEVSAFRPEDAQRIAEGLKVLCEKLINEISEKARQTQMSVSKAELDRAADRLRDLRREQTALRVDQGTIDARKEADAKLQLSTKLRAEQSQLKSEYSSLSSYMDSKSPKLTVLRSQIKANEEQLALMQSQITDTNDTSGALGGATLVTRYDEIETDIDIATKYYQSMLTNFENARMQASNSQIYLATYVQPGMPQIAAYPRVFFDTVLVLLSAIGIWVVSTLIFYSIRDHA